MTPHMFTADGRAAPAGTILQEEIGRGAHSIVYRAIRGDEEYAIKFYCGPIAADEALRLYRREAAINASLRDPAIPRVFEVGLLEGRPYIISEFIRGKTLLHLLGTDQLDVGHVISLGMALADALETLHGHGLVHRDVKPKNVLVASTGDIKLIDFGLASQEDEDIQAAAVGTFRYSAPEQVGMLARPVDGRADLYSLGVVLFECLLGEPPFTADDIGELLHQHAAVRPPRVDALCPTCDSRLADIIARLLEKDPDERFPTGAAVFDAFEALRVPPAGLGPARDRRRRARDARRRVFVGRDIELTMLRGAVDALDRGRGGVFLVEGPPGSGKSVLVEELFAHCTSADTLCLRGKCDATGGYPFAPFRDALRALPHAVDHCDSSVSESFFESLRAAAGDGAGILRQLAPELSEVFSGSGEVAAQWESREAFHNAVVSFLTTLAERRSGAIVWLDDVQWLDDASREVVLMLGAHAAQQRLLLLLTARNDRDCEGALRGIEESLRGCRARSIILEPLSGDDVSALIEQEIGHRLDTGFVRQLAARSHGNPLIVRQYLHAMKENGSLVPSWGRWNIDAEGLASMPLSTDIYALMTSRLAGLTPEARAILHAAALTGHRVVPEQLAYVCQDRSFKALQRALREGLEARLIERSPVTGDYTFVHDRVREALLATDTGTAGAVDTTDDDEAILHRRAADYLGGLESRTDQQVFARAQHCVHGYGHAEPEQTFAACLEAGVLANEQHAYADAHDLLTYVEAGDFAVAADERRRQAFLENLGLACFQTDRVDEAARIFGQALSLAADPVDRAVLRGHIARASVFSFDTRTAIRAIAEAFDELGQTLPSETHAEPAALQGFLVGVLGQSLATVKSGVDFGTARGDDRRICEAIIDLCDIGFLAGYYDRNPLFTLQCGVLAIEPSHRLGETSVACQGFSAAAFLMGVMGKPDAVALLADLSMRIAAKLGDPQTIANTHNKCALGRHLGGDVDGGLALQLDVYQRQADWFGPIAFQNCCVDLSWNYFVRGEAVEELEISEAAVRRLRGRETAFLGGYACRASAAAMAAAATLGRMGEAAQYFKSVEHYESIVPPDRTVPWVSVAGFRVNYYLQQGDLGAGFEAAVRAHDAWGIPAARSALHSKQFYICHAYARLDLLQRADPNDTEQREERLVDFRRAVTELEAATTIPTIRAHLLVLQANLAIYDNDMEGAWVRVDKAQSLAYTFDNPWALFEVARTRARVLRRRGCSRGAIREADRAVAIATQQQWRPRRAQVQHEFDLDATITDFPTAHATTSFSRVTAVEGDAPRLRRQMDAILAMSRASASMLDPRKLAGTALDEAIRIFGAERAYLFAVDDTRKHTDRAEFRFIRGRSGANEELAWPSGYSRTIVDRVRDTGRAVIMSTRADAVALESESVIAYDLRSVLAGPLIAGDRVLGVIYLDNRLARGVFTEEHVELLGALQSHIATAFQTAHSAQLQVRLQKETERRRLAETLRDLNMSLTSTLDLGESLERFVDALARELTFSRAIIFIHEDGVLTPIVVRGPNGAPAVDSAPAPVDLATLAADLGRLDDARVIVDGNHGIATDDEMSLMLPLQSHDVLAGLTFLVRTADSPFEIDDLELGLTIAGQASIAVENAKLFGRVRTLAEIDGLTGLYNRREFFRRAEEAFAEAVSAGSCLSTIMFDVDHFKRFNDTYGHDVGDAVLKLVAEVSRSTIRDEDILGRYGGEEFAIVLPGADACVMSKVGESLRQAIESARLTVDGNESGNESLSVTVSVGATQIVPGDDFASMLSRSDEALYCSKDDGRNRLSVV